MIFLNPRTDIAFKKLFGSEQRKNLTISFLNNILERKPGSLITEVHFRDNANISETIDKKTSFVDINCVDQTGKQYIIEMQVVNEYNFVPRSQYYSAFFLSRQLEKSGEYNDLVPVIFIGVVNYDLFGNEEGYLSHHYIKSEKTGNRLLKHFEWHFIELKNFKKEITQLTNDTDKWIFFIKNASDLEAIPKEMQAKNFSEAFHVLEKTQWKSSELEHYKAQEEQIGREKRQQHGARQEGLQEGRLEEKIDVAKNLLEQNIDINIVANATGLSVEQIMQLKKK